MRSVLRGLLIALAILGVSVRFSFAQTAKAPLSKRELLALVAGNALSENIVQAIEMRGLAFRPDDQFQSLVTEAGGDSRITDAMVDVKTSNPSVTADNKEALLLQHLAEAGKFLQNKQYAEATQALTAALQDGGGAETGFVMAEVLRAQDQWTDAESILREVHRQTPDFSEVHTKLSYDLYRVNNGESALNEARLALAENSKNAEAHKNAGLALQILNRFNASEQEYNEALRLKPDYEPARLDMGILFSQQGKYDQGIVEYKKAIILDAADWIAHYNLGAAYDGKNDLDSAIREYREAKRINPGDYETRQSLGHDLIEENMNAEAVKEFRELQAMYPDSAICHDCLGSEKAEPRYRQLLAALEKQFGPDSPVLLSVLTDEAKALRELGRTEQAEKYEQRAQTIRTATGQPEGGPSAQLPK